MLTKLALLSAFRLVLIKGQIEPVKLVQFELTEAVVTSKEESMRFFTSLGSVLRFFCFLFFCISAVQFI